MNISLYKLGIILFCCSLPILWYVFLFMYESNPKSLISTNHIKNRLVLLSSEDKAFHKNFAGSRSFPHKSGFTCSKQNLRASPPVPLSHPPMRKNCCLRDFGCSSSSPRGQDHSHWGEKNLSPSKINPSSPKERRDHLSPNPPFCLVGASTVACQLAVVVLALPQPRTPLLRLAAALHPSSTHCWWAWAWPLPIESVPPWMEHGQPRIGYGHHELKLARYESSSAPSTPRKEL